MDDMPLIVRKFLADLWNVEVEFLSIFMQDMGLSESETREVEVWFDTFDNIKEDTDGKT